MVARLEKTENGYVIPLTAEMVESLRLVVGEKVEVRSIAERSADQDQSFEDVGDDEALRIYERSKEKFGRAYETLAK